jgi:hypothetical protein
MSELRALPDFSSPLRNDDGVTLFAPYERQGRYAVLPDGLTIARRDDGSPDFRLQLLRGASPMLPPKPHGVLDFRVRPTYRLPDALGMARAQQPDAMVEPIRFTAGFLRLAATADLPDVPAATFAPVALSWNELGIARFLVRLPIEAALKLQGGIEARVFPIQAIAEMEFAGVVPRLPLRVRFDPQKLLEAIGTTVTRDELERLFAHDLLPIEVAGTRDTIAPEQFARAMADRVRMRFGELIASQGNDGLGWIGLQPQAPGSFEWDLSEPVAVTRPLVLMFDPFELPRELVRDSGPAGVIDHIAVPPLRTGEIEVSVTANLPATRVGVLALGATLSAPPHLPNRPQAIEAAVELTPPLDAASARLRFSPAEPTEYSVTPFVVVQTGDSFDQLHGEAKPMTDERVHLTVSDFPVRLVPVEASPGLTAIADLELTASNGLRCSLTPQRSSAAVALPGNTAIVFDVEAHERNGGRVLRIAGLPAAPLWLDLSSFREYGPHRVAIAAAFAPGEKLIAIDLIAESAEDQPQNISVLALTPAQPAREWTYYAASPFACGYRYRIHAGPDAAPAAWSDPQSPYDKLELRSIEPAHAG